MSRRTIAAAAAGLGCLFVLAGCLGSLMSAVAGTDTELGHVARLTSRTADAMRKIGLEEEQAIGLSVGAQIVHAEGVLNCPEVTRYINLVTSVVGAHCDRPTLKYCIAILPTRKINALSCPGGYMFISAGLLLALEDEAELAGVIGHEIAHVCEKHILRTIKNIKWKSVAAEAVAGYDQNAFNNAIDGLTKSTMGAPLSRRYEVNCDRLSTVYLGNCGYDPYGLARALQKMQACGMDTRTGHYGALEDRIREAVEYGRKHGVMQGGRKLRDRYQKRCIQPLVAWMAENNL